jgi:hypothetical protein
MDGTSPETAGLTLAEGKSVLAAIRTQPIQANADSDCKPCITQMDISPGPSHKIYNVSMEHVYLAVGSEGGIN